MAYAALISLGQTLDRLHNSHRIVLKGSTSESTRSLKDEVELTRAVVKKLKNSTNVNRNRINVLDGQIRQAVHEFEDALEFHVSNQLLSQSDEERLVGEDIPVDLQELKQDFQSFTQNLNNMKDAYSYELQRRPSEHNNNNSNINYSDMVGLSDQFNKIKERLTIGITINYTFLGMAGIGKTTLATKLFQDPSIMSLHSKRAFVTVGPEYELERVLLDILKQVNKHGFNLVTKRQDQPCSLNFLRAMIYHSLKHTAFFLLLDDVWDKTLWSNLEASIPMENCRSKILITTRVRRVAHSAPGDMLNIRFLSKEESWDLLRKNVFCKQQDSSLSRELEKAGKKIAERCEGLPLTIITVAEILSKPGEKITAEYWNEVAANKRHPVFVDAYDRMHEVLYPSYEYLNQEWKPCFLYMGVFPQTYEIPISKLKDMLIVEGLCPENEFESTIRHLNFNSVVIIYDISLDREIRTCCLPSPIWHMCDKEATKIKFFRGLDILVDIIAEEDLKGQRRLCVRNNILFAMKDVYDAMASVSTVRSLLCTGPYHQYPVPICFIFLRLLRLLEALTVRFYEFPTKVFNLAQLVYLVPLHSTGISHLQLLNYGTFNT